MAAVTWTLAEGLACVDQGRHVWSVGGWIQNILYLSTALAR